jgi:hypothetical protein
MRSTGRLALVVLALLHLAASACVSVSGAGLDGTYSLDCIPYHRNGKKVAEYDRQIAERKKAIAGHVAEIEKIDDWLEFTAAADGGRCTSVTRADLERREQPLLSCPPGSEMPVATALCVVPEISAEWNGFLNGTIQAAKFAEKACFDAAYLRRVSRSDRNQASQFCYDLLTSKYGDVRTFFKHAALDEILDKAFEVADDLPQELAAAVLLTAGAKKLQVMAECTAHVMRRCSRNYEFHQLERTFLSDPAGLTRHCEASLHDRAALGQRIAVRQAEIAAIEEEARPFREKLRQVQAKMRNWGIDCGR